MDSYDSQVLKQWKKMDFLWILNIKNEGFVHQTKLFLLRQTNKFPDWPRGDLTIELYAATHHWLHLL